MSQDTSQIEMTAQEQGLAQLKRQIERGGFFTHTIVSRNADRIQEAEAFLYGVIDLLVGKGILARDEMLQSARNTRQEMEETGQAIGPGIALRIDGDGAKQEDYVPVNCFERLHICKAVCCRIWGILTISGRNRTVVAATSTLKRNDVASMTVARTFVVAIAVPGTRGSGRLSTG